MISAGPNREGQGDESSCPFGTGTGDIRCQPSTSIFVVILINARDRDTHKRFGDFLGDHGSIAKDLSRNPSLARSAASYLHCFAYAI